MERLKSILADKVLDLSSESGDTVRAKIDKIQRFRDFANALKSLMIKYPAIEDELITMVEDGDFDTKVASSRVDTIIRLADTESAQINRVLIHPEPVQIEPVADFFVNSTHGDDEVTEILIAEDLSENKTEESDLTDYINPDDIPMEIYEGVEESPYQSDSVNLEDLIEPSEVEEECVSYTSVDDQPVSEREEFDTDQSEIIEEEELTAALNDIDDQNIYSEPDIAIGTMPESEEDSDDDITEEEKAAKRKVIIKRIVQVTGIILAVVILIFIIKFVMSHWQTILIVGGVVIVLIILFVWFKRKR